LTRRRGIPHSGQDPEPEEEEEQVLKKGKLTAAKMENYTAKLKWTAGNGSLEFKRTVNVVMRAVEDKTEAPTSTDEFKEVSARNE